jgi:hypothetical protein
MKRICVIGNSHAAALRLALGRGRPGSEFGYSFFAMNGSLHPSLQLKDGRLFAPRPEQVRTDIKDAEHLGIDLSPYDAIVVSAWGLPFVTKNILDQTHPLAEARCADWRVEDGADLPLVSRAVMSEIVSSRLAVFPPLSTIQQMTRVFSGPIIVQPKPKPAQLSFHDREWSLVARYGESLPHVLSDFIDMHDTATKRLFDKIAPCPILLGYPALPDETPFSLPDAYNQTRDGFHKNGLYGAAVIDQIEQALKGRC